MLGPNSPTPSLQAPRYQQKTANPPTTKNCRPSSPSSCESSPTSANTPRPKPSSVICVGYIGSNIHKYLQSKREPSVPVASYISVLSHDRKSTAFSSLTADPSNLRPVMHQSKIAVETKCNSIKLAFLNIRSLKQIIISDQ